MSDTLRKKTALCTIIARNYRAFASVLMQSAAKHHPEWDLCVLVVDGEGVEQATDASAEQGISWLTMADIGLESDDRAIMPMIYDVTELATAVKPWLLETLLRRGAEVAIYLDPDIRLYASCEEIVKLAHEHGIVLTPHSVEPLPRDGNHPSETDIMLAGAYNLGFVAVSSEALTFLRWWQVRLRRECLNAPSQHRFVDQRWVDFVPGYFRCFIFRDKCYNAAYWNLQERQLEKEKNGYQIEGRPLRFYHFSGFDPLSPWILTKHMGPALRFPFSKHPVLAELCEAYKEDLLRAGFGAAVKEGYRFNQTSSGIRIDTALRRLFLEEVIEAERQGLTLPPSPFGNGDDAAFRSWMKSLRVRESGAAYSRGFWWALERWFTIHEGSKTIGMSEEARIQGFRQWLGKVKPEKIGIPLDLIPEWSLDGDKPTGSMIDSFPKVSERAPGLAVTGFFSAEMGLGEAARLLVSGIQASGLSYNTVTARNVESRQEHPFEIQEGGAIHDVNVLCVNADTLPYLRKRLGEEFFDGCYNVGLWFWELEKIASRMRPSFKLVDEVWVASAFIQNAMARHAPVAVHVFPLPIVERPIDPNVTREQLGLPENRFLFLFTFDYMSVFERKNPLGVLRAFRKAFPPGQGPVLVLKSINGDRNPTHHERLLREAAGQQDVIVMDRYLTAYEANSLLGLCDCYVSLHRSEGFGLGMAEAMRLGKPVIATRFSGNLEFMNERNSFLCGYTLTPVGGGHYPYPSGAKWAEPDLDQAAELMKLVIRYPAAAQMAAEMGQRDIITKHSVENTARFLRARYSEIRAEMEARAAKTTKKPPASAAAAVASAKDFLKAAHAPRRSVLKKLRDCSIGWLLKQEKQQFMKSDEAVLKSVDRLQIEMRELAKEVRLRLERVEDRLIEGEPDSE